MLKKISKETTQELIKKQLLKLAKMPTIDRETTPLDEADKLKIQRELIAQNLALIIESAFRGDEAEQSTAFDLTTDYMQEVEQWFNKSIGEARKKAIQEQTANFFTPAPVCGYSLACYLSFRSYGITVSFYLLKNGYTSHIFSDNICNIYIDNTNDAEPFNLKDGYRLTYNGTKEIVKTTYRQNDEYIEPKAIARTATKIYNQQKKALEKVNKLIEELNQTIENASDGVPYDARIFRNGKAYAYEFTKNSKLNLK